MTDIKIPDDKERWEKKGLKEDIDTDAEHVHEIFVWKNFAVEHEAWGERDRGYWNPYVIVNGRPLKLEQGHFDSFDTAVGHLKGLMKDKELTSCDEIDCDDDEDDDDMGCPKHPCGDMIKAKVDMHTRFAMMNSDDDSWKQAYKAEIDGLRKAGNYAQSLKEADARSREMRNPKLKGLVDKVKNDSEMPALKPSDMSYQSVGSDGIPSSHIHNVANTGPNGFGGAVDQNMNGATLNQGLAPGANPLGRDVSGGKAKPAPALGGRTQDMGKLLDRMGVSPEMEKRQSKYPDQYTLYAGLKPIVTQPAQGFMNNSFGKYALDWMNEYNRKAKGIPNANTLFQHDGSATMDDLLNLSPAQLRNLIIQSYKEKSLDGQLAYPSELTNIPIFGGIQYANPVIASRDTGLLNKRGLLDPTLFTMAASERDNLLDKGTSYTRNSYGVFPYRWGGVSGIHPAQDVNGQEDSKWWVRGKERLPSTDLVLDALSEANKKIMDTPVKDSDVQDYIASVYGKDADPSVAISEDVMKNLLSPYLNNEDGSVRIDNAGNPITEENALNMWGADQVRNRQLDNYIDTLEPLVMHWMDNMPMSQMNNLMTKIPQLRRNMAQTDDERRSWYNNLFNSGAVRNRIYDYNPIKEWKTYIGSRDNASSGSTNAQENDQHERESGIRKKPISTGAKVDLPKTDKKTKGGMDMGTKITDEAAASMKDLVNKTGVGNIKTEMNDSKETGAQDDFGIGADAKINEKKAKEDAEKKARAEAEEKADKEKKRRDSGEDVKKAIMNSFAFFSPGFVLAKADEPDVMAGVPDNGKEDTRPRIAAYRTVSMGEGKDSVFNAVVDAETGKIAFTMDEKN